MKRVILFLLVLIHTILLQSQVSSGKLVRLENFTSKIITPRNIDIWLPEGYNKNQKYAVLYMHDGQMLFDSTNTWNKQEWGVDEHLTVLQKDTMLKPAIVVGIWNIPELRHANYFPQKPFESLEESYRDSLYQINFHGSEKLFGKEVNSDDYLKFIVTELKPYIDENYSTLTDPQNTFIMGSSMGGLISMYAICEYPNIFGKAACLSTHWIGSTNPFDTRIPTAFENYMTYYLPCSMDHQLYFDYGTKTLDAYYEPYQLRINEVMKNAGYLENSWKTLKIEGADHSEKSWDLRLDEPLKFLLKK